MNTVEALKNLYKTMTGNDWPYDPNPTDAEVIDKIAADGSAGGSGSGGGAKIISRGDVLEPNLTPEYFCDATIKGRRGGAAYWCPVNRITYGEGDPDFTFTYGSGDWSGELNYKISTGEVYEQV